MEAQSHNKIHEEYMVRVGFRFCKPLIFSTSSKLQYQACVVQQCTQTVVEWITLVYALVAIMGIQAAEGH